MDHSTMTRTPKSPAKQLAKLTPDEMRRGIDRLSKLVERVQQFDPQTVIEQYNIPQLGLLSAAIEEGLARTFGPDTLDCERYQTARVFNNGPHNYAYKVPITEVRQSLERSKQRNIALLHQAIETLEERFSETPDTEPFAKLLVAPSKKVFVVHGHAREPREALARFLTGLGFEPIMLHEQANQGRTIIEKFVDHADVGFAVVLLTPDDVGGAKDGDARPRARQNVILELGYFIGRLARSRVCPLKVGDIELPSDILGIVWTDFDAGGGWKLGLAKELGAAGYDFDWKKVAHA
jgi:predicted nucleotide-binding protein